MTDSDFEQDCIRSARFALDDRGGPALRLPKERALSMVEHALSQTLARSDARSDTTTAIGDLVKRKRAHSFKWLASAAVVLLALAGSAYAALRGWSVPARDAAAAAPHLPQRAAWVSPSGPSPSAEAAAPVAPKAAGQQSAPQHEPRRVPRGESAAHDEPEDLLQAANRLRAQGRFEAAADIYALVYERHPSSIAAYTAEVARATIELEHRGNARYASVLFMRALRRHPDGALDIEVRQGLALALRDLGDTVAEGRALRELIAAHPDSPAADRARARLRERADHTR